MSNPDNDDEKLPECFGNLETVFPKGEDGLRRSPDSCINECMLKTVCLRTAMYKNESGLKVQEENVDRAYQSGMMGFLERWSRKKSLSRKIDKKK
ncbi:MAG: hypothetical protein KJ737_23255 [Proteobacteria bacterium]|nr:hypothetical protein [Pseudomonadota bacterium]